MQHLEVSGAVRPIYGSLGFKRLRRNVVVVKLLKLIGLLSVSSVMEGILRM